MPDILTNCPMTGKPVQTGLDTETVKFETPAKCGASGPMPPLRTGALLEASGGLGVAGREHA